MWWQHKNVFPRLLRKLIMWTYGWVAWLFGHAYRGWALLGCKILWEWRWVIFKKAMHDLFCHAWGETSWWWLRYVHPPRLICFAMHGGAVFPFGLRFARRQVVSVSWFSWYMMQISWDLFLVLPFAFIYQFTLQSQIRALLHFFLPEPAEPAVLLWKWKIIPFHLL
jgi:hypothetical protein